MLPNLGEALVCMYHARGGGAQDVMGESRDNKQQKKRLAYICMYVCMYVYMYVQRRDQHTYVCMYIFMYVCMYVHVPHAEGEAECIHSHSCGSFSMCDEERQ